MSRVVLDCRDWPGPCTLVLAGNEDEVMEAAVQHTVATHDQKDGPELRELIRQNFRAEDAWLAGDRPEETATT